ncbi:MAG: tRNA (guanosine(46)-N7)-methyltransferase TrmB [Planctomycetaceae bacterium]|nr:tRNA (guanosine(46)-N7)-methyltransferase TrmB [Planctomycetaceae bacterium]
MQLNPPRVDLRPWFLTVADLQAPIVWSRFFGNENPVDIDVGCGRGLFLYNESLAHPERNYLGIEIDFKEGRRTATRLKKRQAENARVLGGDVREAFQRLIAPQSVAVVHVYFPDPWWKAKHRKRRVFTNDFVDQVVEVLQPGGVLSSATDVPEYFEVIQGLMDHDPRFKPLPPPPEKIPEHDMDYLTSFERKARQRGETIGRGRWKLR